jgi:hypothetical protein
MFSCSQLPRCICTNTTEMINKKCAFSPHSISLIFPVTTASASLLPWPWASSTPPTAPPPTSSTRPSRCRHSQFQLPPCSTWTSASMFWSPWTSLSQISPPGAHSLTPCSVGLASLITSTVHDAEWLQIDSSITSWLYNSVMWGRTYRCRRDVRRATEHVARAQEEATTSG